MVSQQKVPVNTLALGILLSCCAGVGSLPDVVRTPFTYGNLQPNPGSWMFQPFDESVSSFISAHTMRAAVTSLQGMAYMYIPWDPNARVNAVLGGVMHVETPHSNGAGLLATFISQSGADCRWAMAGQLAAQAIQWILNEQLINRPGQTPSSGTWGGVFYPFGRPSLALIIHVVRPVGDITWGTAGVNTLTFDPSLFFRTLLSAGETTSVYATQNPAQGGRHRALLGQGQCPTGTGLLYSSPTVSASAPVGVDWDYASNFTIIGNTGSPTAATHPLNEDCATAVANLAKNDPNAQCLIYDCSKAYVKSLWNSCAITLSQPPQSCPNNLPVGGIASCQAIANLTAELGAILNDGTYTGGMAQGINGKHQQIDLILAPKGLNGGNNCGAPGTGCGKGVTVPFPSS